MSVHFSSKSNEWETPIETFKELDREFGFTLDAAAKKSNAKCDRYFTIRKNGLDQSWKNETVFLNPPYGREIGKWIRKAFEESKQGATVVCLIPARTDTTYWHEYIFNQPNVEIRFLKGRLKFGKAKNSAPFPSAVVVFRASDHSDGNA